MKKLLLVLASALALLGIVLTVNTLRFHSRQTAVAPAEAAPAIETTVDAMTVAEHLGGAIRFRTVSHRDPGLLETDEFAAFHSYLVETFPRLHASRTRETVGNHSLLYRWEGHDPHRKPILLMAHMDVVPVEPGTEDDWSYPPFAGEIAEGFVWGRGAMDDKGALIGTLEAVESLLAGGFEPETTVYLAFGHDEELGGPNGAMAIAALLSSRGAELEAVLDEGGVITTELLGLDRPVALVGVAEKGFLSLELTIKLEGGHSAMPPTETAIGILSSAVDRLQTHAVTGGIRGATAAMIDYVGPELPFSKRMILANRWLFDPVIERELDRRPESAAMLRTTTAPTIFHSGIKDNVLPSQARAVVNFRILPGDSIASVTDHVRRTVDDPRIELGPLQNAKEPSSMSDLESESFTALQRAVGQVFPDVVVTPWLVVGGTDSRHFIGLSDNVYRFNGFAVSPEDFELFHGTDERLAVEALPRMVSFFKQILHNWAGASKPAS